MEGTNSTYEYLPWRGVTENTMRFFDVKTEINSEGRPIKLRYKYPSSGTKVRLREEKTFYVEGNMSSPQLFGMDKFPPGSAKAITIVEGELDALSTYQLLGSKYPVVSCRSSATARADCQDKLSYEYLSSFPEIYLALDGDKPGKEAAQAIASLFPYEKIKWVKFGDLKDSNEFLQTGKIKEFNSAWWNATRFTPEGILHTLQDFREALAGAKKKSSVSYPWPTLNSMLGGMRKEETVLFTAMEGVGKTEVMRSIAHHILTNTDENVGLLFLEETKDRTLKGLASYELGYPVHLSTDPDADESVLRALEGQIKVNNRLHIYDHFGSADPDGIVDIIRFLSGPGRCGYIFLDHISIVVSGLALDDERKALDRVSTQIATIARQNGCHISFVSHENAEAAPRGSRNISKTADAWIRLQRSIEAERETERNVLRLSIKKNRYKGETGPAGELTFDPKTFTLKEKPGSLGDFGFPPAKEAA